MKNPTMTFGDLANCFNDIIPERKCEIEAFLCLSSWRRPTKEEQKESPNTCLIGENQMFFYRPFKIEDLKID